MDNHDITTALHSMSFAAAMDSYMVGVYSPAEAAEALAAIKSHPGKPRPSGDDRGVSYQERARRAANAAESGHGHYGDESW